jgi:hypothetical protein
MPATFGYKALHTEIEINKKKENVFIDFAIHSAVE